MTFDDNLFRLTWQGESFLGSEEQQSFSHQILWLQSGAWCAPLSARLCRKSTRMCLNFQDVLNGHEK
jgi:hypothetical protein